jgi:hypothetical protein
MIPQGVRVKSVQGKDEEIEYERDGQDKHWEEEFGGELGLPVKEQDGKDEGNEP